jgi:hypothetical protein
MEPCYVLLTIQTYEWGNSQHDSDTIISFGAQIKFLNISVTNNANDYSAKPGLNETAHHMYRE